MTHAVAPDTWLSTILGFPCFRLTPPAHATAVPELIAALEQAAQGQRSFAYIKIPCDQVALGSILTQTNFYVVDVSVTFEREPAALAMPRPSPAITVRPAQRDEYAATRELAAQAIKYSRFHVDPQLTPQQGSAVNWAWMENYAQGRRGEAVDVAELEGRVVGFNAILRAQAGGREYRVVDLLGVHPATQRQGVGAALMAHFIAETSALGLPMRVTTQAANLPAVNLYQGSGFRLVETNLVLHRHSF